MAKRNFINSSHVEGYLYEHDIEERVTGENSKAPGTKYLRGKVDIATDEELTNIVSVYYTYVVPKTSKGQANPTYDYLKDMMDGALKSIMGGATKETAAKLRIDSALGLNEFYVKGQEDYELVSQKRNIGGFIHLTNDLSAEKDRATFNTDILITKTTRKEADEEKGTPEKVIVKGAIFDFRKSLLPVEFTVLNPKAMDYFENLEVSSKEPVFTKVTGKQVSLETVQRIEEESPWGEVEIREVKRSRKDFVITNCNKVPYIWDDEETILASDLKEYMAARETYLATLKQNAIDYAEQKNKPAAKISSGEYDF